MYTYTIRDIAIGRTLGTVQANTERGARIKAQRQFNTDYSYLSATIEAAECGAHYAYELEGRPVVCDLPTGHDGQHTDHAHSAPATMNWDR